MNLVDALADEHLLGAHPVFAGGLATWSAWIVFLKATYGLPLDEREEKVFLEYTGRARYAPPPGGWNEVVLVVGRQSGKTRVASAIVTFEAITAPCCRDGELYALQLAQDQRAAVRAGFSYIKSFFDAAPMLSRAVVHTTADTLRLESGIVLAAYPCRPASVRGLRARVAVCDELAFFRNTEMAPQDTEMLHALRPTLATTGGKLIILSSPYGSSGALWELHRKYFGTDDPHTLVVQASAPAMNPSLPADYLARMEKDDPESYRAEVLGEFRVGLSQLFDPEQVERCVRPEPLERPPARHTRYKAFVDPSGGRSDAAALAIGHLEDDRAIVDLVRAWPAPHNPQGVISEMDQLLGAFGCGVVTGDRFGGEFPREMLRSRGMSYRVSDLDKSRLYLSLLAAVNSQRVELPPDPVLLREARALERRRGPSGRDRVSEPRGAHDDRINAAAGLAHLLLDRDPRPIVGIKF